MYVGKELVLSTGRQSMEVEKMLRGIERKFDDFLDQSDYERVPNVADIMRI